MKEAMTAQELGCPWVSGCGQENLGVVTSGWDEADRWWVSKTVQSRLESHWDQRDSGRTYGGRAEKKEWEETARRAELLH